MKLSVKACAKINLTLDITGVRDDGYHLLDMIMQSVGLCDRLTVETDDSGVIEVTSSNNTLGGEDDIAYKAAKLFLEAVCSHKGVKIYIDKKIPTAAGLGGGSADAAAVLLALNRIFGDVLSLDRLEELSLKLGADVPYFLHGGTVAVSGIGDVFERLQDMPHCHIVIAKNAAKPSTGEMYRRIDSSPVYHPDNKKARKALANGDLTLLCRAAENVFSQLWNCEDVENIMRGCQADAVSLSGSGPSYFAIFKDARQAAACYQALLDANITAFLTEPTAAAIIFE